jgi:hypothetical protein
MHEGMQQQARRVWEAHSEDRKGMVSHSDGGGHSSESGRLKGRHELGKHTPQETSGQDREGGVESSRSDIGDGEENTASTTASTTSTTNTTSTTSSSNAIEDDQDREGDEQQLGLGDLDGDGDGGRGRGEQDLKVQVHLQPLLQRLRGDMQGGRAGEDVYPGGVPRGWARVGVLVGASNSASN